MRLHPAYALMLACRFALALLPLSYIHPDEFHQSTEPLAGSMLHLAHHEPWEWRVPAMDRSQSSSSIIGASSLFGAPLLDPSAQEPIRCVTTATLQGGLGFAALRAVCQLTTSKSNTTLFECLHHLLPPAMHAHTGYLIFVLPRLGVLALSLLFDKMMYSIVNAIDSNTSLIQSQYKQSVLFVLCTSWPTILMLGRSFSNTLELIILTAALCCVTTVYRRHRQNNTTACIVVDSMLHFVFGCCIAFGAFTRITFPLFCAPIGLWLLWIDYNKRRYRLSFVQQVIRLAIDCTFILFGLIVIASTLIAIDSQYFYAHHRLLITIWHNLQFNRNPINVARFGLHPQWLHSLINMQLMFGLMFAVVLYSLAFDRLHHKLSNKNSVEQHNDSAQLPEQQQSSSVASGTSTSGLRRRKTTATAVSQSVNRDSAAPNAIDHRQHNDAIKPKHHTIESLPLALQRCLLGTIVLPLCVLSLAVHQEPRFLLPMLLPLLLLTAPRIHRSNRLFTLHCVLNVVLVLFFGVLHQGGVVRSLLGIQQLLQLPIAQVLLQHNSQSNTVAVAPQCDFDATSGIDLIYYKTYMPMPSLLLIPSHLGAYLPMNAESATMFARPFRVHDLADAQTKELKQRLSQIIAHHEMKSKNASTHPVQCAIQCVAYLALSASVASSSSLEALLPNNSRWRFRLHNSVPLHLATEDMPQLTLDSSVLSALWRQLHLDVHCLHRANKHSGVT